MRWSTIFVVVTLQPLYFILLNMFLLVTLKTMADSAIVFNR